MKQLKTEYLINVLDKVKVELEQLIDELEELERGENNE